MSVRSNLSKKVQSHINCAIEESYKSEVMMRIGCVAVANGKVIGRGHNNYRNRTSDGFVVNNQCTCHAEMDALRAVFHKHGGNTYGKWMDSLKVAKHSKSV